MASIIADAFNFTLAALIYSVSAFAGLFILLCIFVAIAIVVGMILFIVDLIREAFFE